MNSAAFFAGEMDTHHFGDDAAVPRWMQAFDRDRSGPQHTKCLSNETRRAEEISGMRVPRSLAKIATTHGTLTLCQFTLGQGSPEFLTSRFFHAFSGR
jgi:hypothetical protein